jgi:hypothetical protein
MKHQSLEIQTRELKFFFMARRRRYRALSNISPRYAKARA